MSGIATKPFFNIQSYNFDWTMEIWNCDVNHSSTPTLQKVVKKSIILLALIAAFELLIKNLVIVTLFKVVTTITTAVSGCRSGQPNSEKQELSSSSSQPKPEQQKTREAAAETEPMGPKQPKTYKGWLREKDIINLDAGPQGADELQKPVDEMDEKTNDLDEEKEFGQDESYGSGVIPPQSHNYVGYPSSAQEDVEAERSSFREHPLMEPTQMNQMGQVSPLSEQQPQPQSQSQLQPQPQLQQQVLQQPQSQPQPNVSLAEPQPDPQKVAQIAFGTAMVGPAVALAIGGIPTIVLGFTGAMLGEILEAHYPEQPQEQQPSPQPPEGMLRRAAQKANSFGYTIANGWRRLKKYPWS